MIGILSIHLYHLPRVSCFPFVASERKKEILDFIFIIIFFFVFLPSPYLQLLPSPMASQPPPPPQQQDSTPLGYPPPGYPIPLHQQAPPVPPQAPQTSLFTRKDLPQSRDGRDRGCIEGCLAALCCCCVLEECCG